MTGPGGVEAAGVRLPMLEQEILALIAAGASNEAIARELALPVWRVRHQVSAITAVLGLPSVRRPQLVHVAYERGVLPPPAPQRPLVLPLEQERLLLAHIAGESAHRYCESRGLTPQQGQYLQRKLRGSLGARTPADAVRQAWARQILGPYPFATDLRGFRAQALCECLIDDAVIVPLSHHRYRLAVPVGHDRLSGILTLGSLADALAVRAAVRGRPGFPNLRIVHTSSVPGIGYAVVWHEQPAAPGRPSAQPARHSLLGPLTPGGAL